MRTPWEFESDSVPSDAGIESPGRKWLRRLALIVWGLLIPTCVLVYLLLLYTNGPSGMEVFGVPVPQLASPTSEPFTLGMDIHSLRFGLTVDPADSTVRLVLANHEVPIYGG